MNTVEDDAPAILADPKAGGRESRPTPVQSVVDLDILRGWREHRDPELRAAHQLPALAELVQIDGENRRISQYSIHGTDLLIGRFQSQYAPVDILFHDLEDHQIYRLGAPHAHLSFEEGKWHLDVLSPRADTRLNDERRNHLQAPAELADGDIITLGVTRLRFCVGDATFGRWKKARQQLFGVVDEPALFLKRRGGPCGPFIRLDEERPLFLGRTHPNPGVLPNTSQWPEPDTLRWDLSGLHDFERRFVAFRHARIDLHRGRWTISPMSARQRTFVNRIAISGRIALESGDEIGLGSILLRFHHPHRAIESSRPRHIPEVVDWSEGRVPSKPAPSPKDEK